MGHGGKPFLIPGPRDDADELISLLADRFGPNGFHYIAKLD